VLERDFFHEDEVAGKDENLRADVGCFADDLISLPLIPRDKVWPEIDHGDLDHKGAPVAAELFAICSRCVPI
jgi:hypothetical protein